MENIAWVEGNLNLNPQHQEGIGADTQSLREDFDLIHVPFFRFKIIPVPIPDSRKPPGDFTGDVDHLGRRH